VKQPPSFESEGYPNHIYKLYKVLYELKSAPRAWYECLRDLLIENGFKIVRSTLLSLLEKWVKIYLYVKSILMILYLVLLKKSFCDEFSKIITDMLEMYMMGVLTFFLGFQIKQAKEGTSLAK
jgi:hypothetical protein